MRKSIIKSLIFPIFFGWAIQNFAEEYSSEMPEIEFAGQDDVKPVTIRDRILWGGGALLSLPKERGPIPLYSYPISQLPEDTALDALSLAAKGKVYIAIVTFNDSEQKSGAEARGLKVPADWNSISNKEWKKEEWESFQTEHFADKDNVRIAFTRPLVLKKIDRLTAREREALANERNKFVTSMSLWSEAKN